MLSFLKLDHLVSSLDEPHRSGVLIALLLCSKEKRSWILIKVVLFHLVWFLIGFVHSDMVHTCSEADELIVHICLLF
jgi:hypothetical protein